MFERFTNQSRRVVVLAQEEARMLNHNYIGTEHLLLGLLHEGRGSAARALTAMDVTLSAARDQVVAIVGRGQEQASGHIPFTPRAKKSLELSLREALQLGDGYIGTGHLMLGVIRQGDNVAIKVLDKLGADLSNLRARVTRELRDHPEDQDAPATEREQRRVRVILHDSVQSLLDTIDDRLSAIERHLGLTRLVSTAPRSLDERIAVVQRDKEAAIDAQDFSRAAELRDTEKQLIEERKRVELEDAAAAEAAVGRDAEAALGRDAEATVGRDAEAAAGEAANGTETGPVGEAADGIETGPAAGTANGIETGSAAGTGGAAGEADELTRLQARVARLEERLREHGLDPEEPQEPPAAAG
jgi:Clp amino terminal domain, pathogenicity island component/UvrB/uvrC motif